MTEVVKGEIRKENALERNYNIKVEELNQAFKAVNQSATPSPAKEDLIRRLNKVNQYLRQEADPKNDLQQQLNAFTHGYQQILDFFPSLGENFFNKQRLRQQAERHRDELFDGGMTSNENLTKHHSMLRWYQACFKN